MLTTSADIKDNFEKRFQWVMAHLIAEDPERELQLFYTSGRTKAGTGSGYLLMQYGDYDSRQRAHKFKAFGDQAAIDHMKKFLERNWKD